MAIQLSGAVTPLPSLATLTVKIDGVLQPRLTCQVSVSGFSGIGVVSLPDFFPHSANPSEHTTLEVT